MELGSANTTEDNIFGWDCSLDVQILESMVRLQAVLLLLLRQILEKLSTCFSVRFKLDYAKDDNGDFGLPL